MLLKMKYPHLVLHTEEIVLLLADNTILDFQNSESIEEQMMNIMKY